MIEFNLNELKSLNNRTDFKSTRGMDLIQSKDEFLKFLGIPDLINLTPILFTESQSMINKSWLPSYDEACIQLYGYDMRSDVPIDPVSDGDYNISLSLPIKYSIWINEEIHKKYDMISKLSDDRYNYVCQECFQRLDWAGVIIGLDVWKHDNDTNGVEMFSVLTKSYLYQGLYTDDSGSGSIDTSTAIIKDFKHDYEYSNPIYSMTGTMERPNVFYRINSGFYGMYNKVCTHKRRYNNNLDFRLD